MWVPRQKQVPLDRFVDNDEEKDDREPAQVGTLAQSCEAAGNGSTMYQEGLAILKRKMMLVLLKIIHERWC